MPRGRPTEYTQERADIVCARMATGESLRSICRDKTMPAESTVRLWAIDDREGFAAHYARAREAQVEALAEDLIEIADDKNGDAARDRLRVDTRKWVLSKIAPKKYGDKLGVEHSGGMTVRHEDALEQLK